MDNCELCGRPISGSDDVIDGKHLDCVGEAYVREGDLTDYSPAVRKLMADPVARRAALVELSLDSDAAIDLVAMMHHPHIGAMALTARLVKIYQAMVDKA